MAITLKDINLKYGERTIFRKLSYQFKQGIYLISGESGIGKTTLFNLIKGFVQPDEGFITRDHPNISYMMQETLLFSNLSLKENFIVKYMLNHDLKDEGYEPVLLKYMENVGLRSDLLNTKVFSLSGGQKRKLELLLISCNPSNIILLDEPVANLDKESIQHIVSYIENNLSNEKTVIISSHSEMNFAGKVERLIMKNETLNNV
ncbi:ABC transporter ATP-binding protein [Paenibacillus pabuli]|uniref:ABC transporter ATP-binding protein n=1 Tax=Paenibacillus pabuli TaxID=1472 RepID=UPI001FFFA807|nr:ATP-binding cassette domain-containing protein [Paenibacillus pabuli]UPK44966.1 ATP-binding cassette domain-containing protein [Paenibacillus pabuli]